MFRDGKNVSSSEAENYFNGNIGLRFIGLEYRSITNPLFYSREVNTLVISFELWQLDKYVVTRYTI